MSRPLLFMLSWVAALAMPHPLSAQTEAPRAPSAATPTVEWVGRARAVDGRTLVLAGRTVRLLGIDAPAAEQVCLRDGAAWACGVEAAAALAHRVGHHLIVCRVLDPSRDGAARARCTVGGADLAAYMIADGLAVAEPGSDLYVAAEATARAGGAGLWRSTFVPPADWRRGVRLSGAAQAVPPAPCRIKGVHDGASAQGRRALAPDHPDYAAATVDPRRGDQWFCTLPQARAAGFLPAR